MLYKKQNKQCYWQIKPEILVWHAKPLNREAAYDFWEFSQFNIVCNTKMQHKQLTHLLPAKNNGCNGWCDIHEVLTQ